MRRRTEGIVKWVWSFGVVMYLSPSWSVVCGVVADELPNNHGTVEAQAKFFQDFFSVQLSPYKMEFGHVCEDPSRWEQRYEHKDYKTHRDMGKVRWGDKNGGYGEHYWDLNHAGAGNNDPSDDGDNGSHDANKNDDESSGSNNKKDKSQVFEAVKSSVLNNDENGRKKRAHGRVKQSKHSKEESYDESLEETTPIPKSKKLKHYNKDTKTAKGKVEHRTLVSDEDLNDQNDEEDEVEYDEDTPVTEKQSSGLNHENLDDQSHTTTEKPPLQPTQHDELYPPLGPVPRDQNPYFHFDNAVKQKIRAPPPLPRLFFEPTTGHVIDRVTGQAYVLQPITPEQHESGYN